MRAARPPTPRWRLPGPRWVAVVAVLALFGLGAPAGAADKGPPLTVPRAQLDAALSCQASVRPGRTTVLLVHGTQLTADESWGWNYTKVLPRYGYGVCAVTLPGRARGDIQVSSEYVVHAIRHIRKRIGGRVDVIGHSQGAIVPRWALAFWPDVRASVDDYISLAGPHHGLAITDVLCSGGSCYAAAWQTRSRSRAAFIRALNRRGESVAGVATTSIFSEVDTIVQPYQTAQLAGAANISLQRLCPGRPVDHMAFLYDAVTFQLVLDALRHAGPTVPARAGVDCTALTMPGVTAPDIAAGEARIYGNAGYASAEADDNVSAEPPLKPYAR